MKYKHIHFIGVKGVGVAPLAIIAKEAGITVSGCDTDESFITDEPLHNAGITPLVGFNEEHVKNADLVITTGAHGGKNNPEVQAAEKLGIPVWMQGEAVGKYMKGELFERVLKGISVAGCHGKTTTTAMTATIFKEAGYDPSFLIGTGDIPSLGGSGHYGKGDYFIAEADEYANEPKIDPTPKFLLQYPEILIITNIEYDHPDLYPTFASLLEAYIKLVKNIDKKGVLITNGDEINSGKIVENHVGKSILFGFDSSNNCVITLHDTQEFTLVLDGQTLGTFSCMVPGKHNVLNATAAILAAYIAGVPLAKIQKGIAAFTGTKRRYEYIGRLVSGAYLFDDYAHHPTEIAATLRALRSQFSNKRILAIFQPHTYSRTKSLFDQFKYSFESADRIILMDIFASKREALDPTVSSQLLATAVNETGKDVLYLPTILDVIQYLNDNNFTQDTVIITLGAGDIYKIFDKLAIQI